MNSEVIKKPLVSAIVVTYNSSAYVIETLNSIKAQRYEPIELIVTDDCSTDNTVETCRKWIGENSDRFVNTQIITSKRNTGIAPNLNRGLRASTGEWLYTIAGDDALFQYTFEKYMEYAKQNPEAEFIHSNVAIYKGQFLESNRLKDRDTANFKINQPDITAAEQFQILLRVSKIWAATTMERRSLFERIGYYNEKYPMYEDLPRLLSITKNDVKLHYIDIYGAKYRRHVNSVQKKQKENNLFTAFRLDRDRAVVENYLQYLPSFERFIKKIYHSRSLFLLRNGLNKNNVFIKTYLYVTEFFALKALGLINKKYK